MNKKQDIKICFLSSNSKEAKNIYLENLLKFKSENGKIFWFTLESSLSKSLICKHVHKSKYGHICADHSF